MSKIHNTGFHLVQTVQKGKRGNKPNRPSGGLEGAKNQLVHTVRKAPIAAGCRRRLYENLFSIPYLYQLVYTVMCRGEEPISGTANQRS